MNIITRCLSIGMVMGLVLTSGAYSSRSGEGEEPPQKRAAVDLGEDLEAGAGFLMELNGFNGSEVLLGIPAVVKTEFTEAEHKQITETYDNLMKMKGNRATVIECESAARSFYAAALGSKDPIKKLNYYVQASSHVKQLLALKGDQVTELDCNLATNIFKDCGALTIEPAERLKYFDQASSYVSQYIDLCERVTASNYSLAAGIFRICAELSTGSETRQHQYLAGASTYANLFLMKKGNQVTANDYGLVADFINKCAALSTGSIDKLRYYTQQSIYISKRLERKGSQAAAIEYFLAAKFFEDCGDLSAAPADKSKFFAQASVYADKFLVLLGDQPTAVDYTSLAYIFNNCGRMSPEPAVGLKYLIKALACMEKLLILKGDHASQDDLDFSVEIADGIRGNLYEQIKKPS